MGDNNCWMEESNYILSDESRITLTGSSINMITIVKMMIVIKSISKIKTRI
jgi:hypothetical protein